MDSIYTIASILFIVTIVVVIIGTYVFSKEERKELTIAKAQLNAIRYERDKAWSQATLININNQKLVKKLELLENKQSEDLTNNQNDVSIRVVGGEAIDIVLNNSNPSINISYSNNNSERNARFLPKEDIQQPRTENKNPIRNQRNRACPYSRRT